MDKQAHQNLELSHAASLRPSFLGARPHLAVATLTILSGLLLSILSSHLSLWLIGQLVLGIGLTQVFVLMHEAGHGTLLKSEQWNRVIGSCCGFLCLFPFNAWKLIHRKHHVWTGWKDKDPTTENLLPREIKTWEKLVFNNCWRFWIPIFGVAYRIQHFWNPLKFKHHASASQRRTIIRGIILQLTAYALLIAFAGWWVVLSTFGLAFFIHLTICDPIILSQHSHIPQEISEGKDVAPFDRSEQDVFTRSLEFPKLFSKWVLLRFDLHELHHMYPRVPGYHLDKLPTQNADLPNTYNWWTWIREAKRLPAHQLIFHNRDETGWTF